MFIFAAHKIKFWPIIIFFLKRTCISIKTLLTDNNGFLMRAFKLGGWWLLLAGNKLVSTYLSSICICRCIPMHRGDSWRAVHILLYCVPSTASSLFSPHHHHRIIVWNVFFYFGFCIRRTNSNMQFLRLLLVFCVPKRA